ncbi:MAG: sulfotransferase [Chloroflexi bacterium]|nr:sulfotransferase [Chloroflexota bacterium]MCI0575251.1 sulfotransferase [Chloroflexota bacterium]MCI0645697.1 sulfotransferase [Chloroflexota bacterium]MCI0731790.1 sulfotransferase [Chloroflexota bacterium]
MKIEKPIIIVGTGRCGSTMMHRLLARHEDVGWLSTFNEVLPTFAWLSVFSNLYRLPWLGRKIKHLPFFPKPFEAYRFWEHYLPGFSRRDRPLTAEDVPAEGIAPVRRAVEQLLKFQNKDHFLIKVTGWSRMAYFDRIFSDALFVFLKREHRSVVSSWVQAGWLDVTSGLDEGSWQWGEVPADYRQLWEELGRGPLLSAAVKIQMDLDDIERNVTQFPERSYELQYEELIMQPEQTLRPLLAFCGLDWTPQFERVVKGMAFYNPVNKWRKYLSEEEGDLILEFFERAKEQKQVAVYF